MKTLKWTKDGGCDQSRFIRYTADAGGFEIHRARIGGEWTKPVLYRHDVFVLGFNTVAEAKQHAASLMAEKPLTEIL